MNIPAQIVGIAGMTTLFLTFQVNDRRKIILIQIINAILWTIHYYMLNSMAGAAINVICFLRNLLFIQRGKNKFCSSNLLPVFVCLVEAAATIAVWAGPVDALAIAGACLQTTSLWLRQENRIRITSLIASPIWLVYDAINGSYVGIITECAVTTSLLISIYRFDIRPKLKKAK